MQGGCEPIKYLKKKKTTDVDINEIASQHPFHGTFSEKVKLLKLLRLDSV